MNVRVATVESQPDLVTGTVFKTVVGASNALGRVQFPCGSAILLLILTTALHAHAASSPDLDAAAHALAQDACSNTPHPALQQLRQAGVLDAQVAVCVQHPQDPPDALSTCVTANRSTVAPSVEATATEGGCTTTLLVRRIATITAFPATAPRFAQLALHGQPAAGYGSPQWLLMDPKGHVEALPTSTSGDATATLHGGAGGYTFQLMLKGPRGPEVATTRILPVDGDSLPAALDLDVPDASPATLSMEALRLFRTREALPPLAPDADLNAAAQRRLEALLQGGPLLHVDPAGLDIVASYGAQPGHLPVSRLAEVLSGGPSPLAAFNALLRSPAHRMHLSDANFTHAGAAVGRQPLTGEWILVVALSRPVLEPDSDVARAAVLQRLNAHRTRRGLKPLILEDGLLDLCRQHARRLAKAQRLSDETPQGRRLADVALEMVGARRAGVQLYRVGSVEDVGSSATVLGARYRKAGVGLHKGPGVDGLYVVVVLIEE